MAPDTCDQATAHAAAMGCTELRSHLRHDLHVDPDVWGEVTTLGRLRAELASLGPVTP